MSKNDPSGPSDLLAAAKALTQATEALNQAASRIIHLAQSMDQASSGERQVDSDGLAVASAQINIFEDDAFSEVTPTRNPPIADTTVVNVSLNNNPLLQIRFTTAEPIAARYPPGSTNFRHWAAKEALTRGINFWAPLLPIGTRWSTVNPMTVTLIAGQALNANYTRIFGLRFFQQTVGGVPIFAADSPDVVCHELGHAILDALRPELFNAPFAEVAAFHESFGDMSAILSALQGPTFRQRVLAETTGRLNVNSRLSRLAEQLGWGIRQLSPTAVDRDSLRNAANRFFYQPPAQLPPTAPADQLSSDAHFFSRVFTGAFLDILARMLSAAGGATDGNLLMVSQDLGALLADGIRTAPVVPAYYSQVAASMIQADRVRNNGRYQPALNSAFVERGILSPGAVNSLASARIPQFKPSAPVPPTVELLGMARSTDLLAVPGDIESMLLDYDDGAEDGYRRGPEDDLDLPLSKISTSLGVSFLAHTGNEVERFSVAPGAFASGDAERSSPERAAENFLEDLIQLRRIDFTSVKEIVPQLQPFTRERTEATTHTVIECEEGQVLKRLQFNCGFHHNH